ncbi:MAG: DnaJ domain-containing protein [Deltaproteobacteria bacterium]|nr:DnaJ domain-containing protein [Deltaproteobacteria bacterium]
MVRGKTAGTLASYPLPRLILFARKKGFCGILRLDVGSEADIHFLDGKPVFVTHHNDADLLGRILIQARKTTAESVRQALAIQQEQGGLLGRILVGQQALSQKDLVSSLQLQQRRKLLRMIQFDDGSFQFVPAPPPSMDAAELKQMAADPMRLIWDAVTSLYPEARLRAELAPIWSTAIRIMPTEDGPFDQMPLHDQHKAARALLERGYWLPEDLIDAVRATPGMIAAALQVAYWHWATGNLDLQAADTVPRLKARRTNRTAKETQTRMPQANAPETSKPQRDQQPTKKWDAVGAESSANQDSVTPRRMVPPSQEQATKTHQPQAAQQEPRRVVHRTARYLAQKETENPASSMKPLPHDANDQIRQLYNDLRTRLTKVSDQNLFEILGVPLAATKQQIKDVYLSLAKKYHPDRIATLEVEVLNEPASLLFQRISEAFTTLIDDHQRSDYRRIIEDGTLAGGRQAAQAIMEAEINFQKGEVFFKKGRWDDAEQMFQDAVDGNPEEGEHLAMLVWTRYCRARQTSRQADIREKVQDQLEEALRLSPKCARAHYFLGKILAEKAQTNEALNHLETAIKLDHNLVDAAREINIIKLRRNRTTKTAKTSFWNKLRGSK